MQPATQPSPSPSIEFASDDQARIRATVAPIAADPAGFARDFYDRLFAHSPGLRTLFPADMQQQHKKLSQTLCVVVAGLDRPEQFVPTLLTLGAAHRRYGAKAMHFLSVGEALIETLAAHNGTAFDRDARAAWVRLYGWVAQQMQRGAQASG